jgi:putative two-component system response regulator
MPNETHAPSMDATGKIERLRVLVVDDDEKLLAVIRRLLGQSDFELLVAHNPLQAMTHLRQQEVAVVVSDQMMPLMNGVELLTLVRQNWPSTICIMMTGCGDMQMVSELVNRQLVHYFITKPWSTQEFRQLVLRALEVYRQRQAKTESAAGRPSQQDLKQYTGQAAFSLARAVDARDRYTHHHSENVAAYAQVLANAMNLNPLEVEEFRIGGMLHDIGKIGVSDDVLLKPSGLSQEEFRQIQLHPGIGVSIIEPMNFSHNIEAIVGQHHENYDGSGYPKGLSGNDIALAARIVHVVDAFEAMSANRVYRTARSSEWILSEFTRFRGSQFDPDITDVFLREFQKGSLISQ